MICPARRPSWPVFKYRFEVATVYGSGGRMRIQGITKRKQVELKEGIADGSWKGEIFFFWLGEVK